MQYSIHGSQTKQIGIDLVVNNVAIKPEKLSTGSKAMDALLHGGLPYGSLTDVFGPAGSGKSQLAFQISMMTALGEIRNKPLPEDTQRTNDMSVAFVDCAGSFRPERIAEIANARGLWNERTEILQRIYSIRTRNKGDQVKACGSVLFDERFRRTRLLIVDDVTANFVTASGSSSSEIIERQQEISLYVRNLAFISVSKRIPVFVTNTVRFRDELRKDMETIGDLLSMHSFLKVRLSKRGRERTAVVEQPYINENRITFEINAEGIN